MLLFLCLLVQPFPNSSSRATQENKFQGVHFRVELYGHAKHRTQRFLVFVESNVSRMSTVKSPNDTREMKTLE
jgi:hypothetical protein